MRIAAISDLHGQLLDLSRFSADLLLIAGDFCPVFDHDVNFQHSWFNTNFNTWLKEQLKYFRYIVYIGGNHDIFLQQVFNSGRTYYQYQSRNVIYLQDSKCEVDGLKIWGSPRSLPFGQGWVFNSTEEELAEVYAKIPDDADIIVSHGPPKGYGDRAPRQGGGFEETGSIALLEAIDRVNPKLCCFGHIHPGRGIYQRNNTKLVNAALLDDNYKLVNEPYIIDLL